MKNDGKTKLFVGAILGILLVISALIGLVLWPIHNELYPGMKTLYLVTKITVLVIFAIHIIFCLLPKAKFATKNLMKMKIELDIVLIIKDKKSSKVSCLL